MTELLYRTMMKLGRVAICALAIPSVGTTSGSEAGLFHLQDPSVWAPLDESRGMLALLPNSGANKTNLSIFSFLFDDQGGDHKSMRQEILLPISLRGVVLKRSAAGLMAAGLVEGKLLIVPFSGAIPGSPLIFEAPVGAEDEAWDLRGNAQELLLAVGGEELAVWSIDQKTNLRKKVSVVESKDGQMIRPMFLDTEGEYLAVNSVLIETDKFIFHHQIFKRLPSGEFREVVKRQSGALVTSAINPSSREITIVCVRVNSADSYELTVSTGSDGESWTSHSKQIKDENAAFFPLLPWQIFLSKGDKIIIPMPNVVKNQIISSDIWGSLDIEIPKGSAVLFSALHDGAIKIATVPAYKLKQVTPDSGLPIELISIALD